MIEILKKKLWIRLKIGEWKILLCPAKMKRKKIWEYDMKGILENCRVTRVVRAHWMQWATSKENFPIISNKSLRIWTRSKQQINIVDDRSFVVYSQFLVNFHVNTIHWCLIIFICINIRCSDCCWYFILFLLRLHVLLILDCWIINSHKFHNDYNTYIFVKNF